MKKILASVFIITLTMLPSIVPFFWFRGTSHYALIVLMFFGFAATSYMNVIRNSRTKNLTLAWAARAWAAFLFLSFIFIGALGMFGPALFFNYNDAPLNNFCWRVLFILPGLQFIHSLLILTVFSADEKIAMFVNHPVV